MAISQQRSLENSACILWDRFELPSVDSNCLTPKVKETQGSLNPTYCTLFLLILERRRGWVSDWIILCNSEARNNRYKSRGTCFYYFYFIGLYLGCPASLERFYLPSAAFWNTRTSRAGKTALPPQQMSFLCLPMWNPWLSLALTMRESWEDERGQRKVMSSYPAA